MLKNKTALITGGSRGIGRAIALAMAREEASVAVLYRGREEAAQETLRLLRETGAEAEIYQCNAASAEETAKTVRAAAERFGRIDILVNNAGITRDNLILMMREKEFDEVLEVNLKGAFLMTSRVGGIMLKQRSGRIINIASIAGMMGNAGQANYAAAKAGLIALTKTTARELAGRGITCNAIAPGFIATDMTKMLGEGKLQEAEKSIPLGRIGAPEDVAAAAVFLAGDGASYITGSVLKVDGGLYI